MALPKLATRAVQAGEDEARARAGRSATRLGPYGLRAGSRRDGESCHQGLAGGVVEIAAVDTSHTGEQT